MNILLIDDEPEILKILELYLTKKQHSVKMAENGKRGLQHFFHSPDQVDLVLCDVRMPNTNGIDVLKQIRLSGSQVPFVFMSGHADEEMNVQETGLAFDHFLLKPFNMKRVIELVEAY